MSDDDVTHAIWLIYRAAVAKHVESASKDIGAHFGETEAQYRERAEKAGLIAVANFVGKAYQQSEAA